MGRYNNRRTQAAAEALKNTPSRARFSKGPPNKNQRKSTKATTTTTNKDGTNPNQQQQQRGGRGSGGRGRGGGGFHSHLESTARVIDKLQSRQQQQQQPSRTATTEESLDYVDVSKYDRLQLPTDILKNITDLLERLGVMESNQNHQDQPRDMNRKNKVNSTIGNLPPDTVEEEEEDYADDDEGRRTSEIVIGQSYFATTTTTNTTTKNSIPFSGTGNVGDYSEYENDFDEQEDDEEEEVVDKDFENYYYYQYDVDQDNYYDNEGNETGDDQDDDDDDDENDEYDDQDEEEEDDQQQQEDDDDDDDENQKKKKEEEVMESNTTFIYLTERLSFSRTDARRACVAIEDWEAISDNLKKKGGGEGKKKDDDKVALAMDWLCLHLEERQLIQGFLPNKNPPKSLQSTSSLTASKSGIPLVSSGMIKIIPHPSISLDTDTLSDTAWARSVRKQERIFKFVRLGFRHEEATNACERTSSTDDVLDAQLTKKPPLEDPALPILLASLRDAVTDDEEKRSCDIVELNDMDLQFAAEERQNEKEALMAIFDDNFQVCTGERYCIKIHPVERLKEPARSDDCWLHVFMRPGYPVVETALFWFVNSSLPPTLLRTINEFVAKQALENLGLPSVFEAVNSLTEALPELQRTFIREQKRKEFEAEQIRMRKQVDQSSNHDDSMGKEKLGRRQQAKLKAAEKAFDRSEKIQREEEDRKQRQTERIQRAQEESARVRHSHVEQTLLKREQEKLEEELERVGRSAMSAAFNRGENVDQARSAAAKAKEEYLREYGGGKDETSLEKKTTETVTVSRTNEVAPNVPTTANTASFMDRLREEGTEQKQRVETNATNANGNPHNTTPTTMAFMERLRQMYDSAAQKKKTGYHLTMPAQEDSSKLVEETNHHHHQNHIPRPVAVPTGEMLDVITDVLKIQEEQPWLVSPEARVPTLHDEHGEDESLSLEQKQKKERLSMQLKQDLENKLKRTGDQGQNGGDSKKSRAPQKTTLIDTYQSMLAVRQKLPAFKMANQIVDMISTNQVTVIAGDTGCGKFCGTCCGGLPDLFFAHIHFISFHLFQAKQLRYHSLS